MKNIPIFLVLITILGTVLRFTYLSQMPPSLNWDEVSHGYNAYSILKTGKDEWGIRLPIIFQAYGDYKLPIYIYVTVVSEFFFGLNALAVRFPSALAGILTIIFTYLLSKKLFEKYENKETLALLTSFLIAIEPWSLFVSRGAFEANLCLFFIVTGVYFLLLGLEKKYYLLISSLFFGFSVWTYNSARIFSPLILMSLVFIYRKEISLAYHQAKRTVFYSLLIILIFFIPMLIQLINPVGQARYSAIEIVNVGAIENINSLRNSSALPSILPKLLYNKVTYFISVSAKQYINHFGPGFLFLKGSTDYQFNIPNVGLLYLLDLPFIILGLIFLLKNLKEKSFQLIIFWLLLSPIASSITRDSPHVLRSLVMLPIPMILTSIGISQTIRKNVFFGTLVVITFLLLLENYLNIYASSYRVNYSWSWQYGYKEVVSYVKANYANYDQIITTKAYGEPHEYFLFFLNYDPSKFRNDPQLIRFYQSNWYWVDHFDKFWFVNDWQVKDLITESKHKINCTNQRCLIITTPDNAPKGFAKISEERFLDNKVSFEFYKN